MLSPDELPRLSAHLSQDSLSALIVLPQTADPTYNFLTSLEESLKNGFAGNQNSLVELVDPEDTDAVYFLATASGPTEFGKHIRGAGLGLFRFNLQELLGNDTSLILRYIMSIKQTRSSIYNELIRSKEMLREVCNQKECFQSQAEADKRRLN